MRTIYKYPIEIADEQAILMPQGAEVIHAGLDPQGSPCVWAVVDTISKPEPVRIFVRGTGEPITCTPGCRAASCTPHVGRHISSFTQGAGVWHVFVPIC